MSGILRIRLCLCFGLGLLLWAGSSAPGWAESSAHTTVASNVRQGPSLDQTVLRVLPAGTAITVTGRNAEGTWLQLADGAWIHASLIAPALSDLPVVGAMDPVSAATDSGVSELEYRSALVREHLVDINALRIAHEAQPLTLADAGPAQTHATELASGAFASHWDRSGLAPYMRYTRDVGAGAARENVYRTVFSGEDCIPSDYDYADWLQRALADLEASPGHQSTLLHEHATEARIGLARSCHALVLVQVLGHRQLLWTRPPELEGDMLHMEGTVDAPARVGSDTQVLIAWEPLPQPLSLDQLAQTGCYSLPRRILVGVRRARPDAEARVRIGRCAAPIDADPEYNIPTDPDQAHQERSWFADSAAFTESYSVPVRRGRTWDVRIHRFRLAFDLREPLRTWGDGIYTIALWGQIGSERALLGQYALVVSDQSDLW